MEKHFQFNSKDYVPISWKMIFSDAFFMNYIENTITAFVNSRGLIISPNKINKKSECILYNKNYSFLIDGNQLLPVSNYHLRNDKIYLYKINSFFIRTILDVAASNLDSNTAFFPCQ